MDGAATIPCPNCQLLQQQLAELQRKVALLEQQLAVAAKNSSYLLQAALL
jgi:hypothetical protein